METGQRIIEFCVQVTPTGLNTQFAGIDDLIHRMCQVNKIHLFETKKSYGCFLEIVNKKSFRRDYQERITHSGANCSIQKKQKKKEKTLP